MKERVWLGQIQREVGWCETYKGLIRVHSGASWLIPGVYGTLTPFE